MEEQKQNEVENVENTNSNEENLGPVQEAKKVLEEIKAQNKTLSENLKKAEEMQVVNMLSGKAEAGQVPKTQEQKEIESARKLLKGTGYEDVLFPK